MIFTITNTINIDVNEIYDDWKEHSFDGQALNSCIEQAMDYNLDDMEISEEDEKNIFDGIKKALLQKYYDAHALDEQAELQALIDKINAHNHRIQVDDKYKVSEIEVLK